MTNRPKLSLCMIVRNNAQTIAPCLSSIRDFVDEMVVVDTGSLDNTPEIAQRLGAKVFHFPWVDSFSAARNESLRLATGEWLFWMDSDDVIDAVNARGLRELAYSTHPPNIAGYVVQVHCPDWRSEGDVTVVDHIKLFRNHPPWKIRFEHRIHEQVMMPIRRLGGEIAWTDLFVVHANSDHTPEGRQRKIERDLRLLQLDLQDFPDHPFVLFNFGMTYNDMGQHAEAISWLERCITTSNGIESHLRKAYALLVHSLTEVGRLDDASNACRYALCLFPKDAELQFRQGMLLHQMNRFGEAVQAYRAVLCNGEERQLTSRCQAITGYKARHNLAIVYGDAGVHSLAELQWRTILDEKPEYRPAWKSVGQAMLRQGRHSAAKVHAENMSNENSLRADGLILQAELAMKAGDKTDAISVFDRAQKEFPDDLDLVQSRCRVMFEHQAWEDAEQALTDLTRRLPNDGAAWHNLGLVYLHRGNLDSAQVALRNSLDFRPDSPKTRQLLSELSSRNMTNQADDMNLPPCHSRRDFDPAAGLFLCAHPRIHVADNVVTSDICRGCTYWQQPPPAQFREFPPGEFIVRHGLCSYLGEQIGLRDCPSCRGNVKVKVFACAHPGHETTTINDCARCPEYQPRAVQSNEEQKSV